MPALFLNLLKIIFLLLIYIFLWQVARSMRSHVSPNARRSNKTAREIAVVRSETLAGRRFSLEQPKVIGRSSDADIIIDDSYASEFHLRIGFQDGEVILNDLGSTNGTYLNGRRVSVPTAISSSDSIQIGKTIFEVR
tara:strand:- start:32 stop:442 length:411 start_codon:yes stop_codon:yes gene_type:complete